MLALLKKFKLLIIGIILLILPGYVLIERNSERGTEFFMGGFVHTNNGKPLLEQTQAVYNSIQTDSNFERFQRPSKQPALILKYNVSDFFIDSEQPPYITTKFQTPEDLIHAYYAIIKNASNMDGYGGGCGTIGWSKLPYPYAYELLSNQTRKQMSFEDFVDSFAGTGYTTLLKIFPAYQPLHTPENIRYYITEIEIITGRLYDAGPQPSYFAYYYGLITTEKSASEGWKIKSINYIPEDFLCHPAHHWEYDARSFTDVVYKGWYGLIENIEKVDRKDTYLQIYAAGKGNKYKFEFVRLTNGDEVLLHEYIFKDNRWQEANLLKEEHQNYKFSILNPGLNVK